MSGFLIVIIIKGIMENKFRKLFVYVLKTKKKVISFLNEKRIKFFCMEYSFVFDSISC